MIGASIPDPWIEDNQLDPILDVSPSPEIVGQTGQKNIDRDDDWKGWDEVDILRMVYSGVHYPTNSWLVWSGSMNSCQY